MTVEEVKKHRVWIPERYCLDDGEDWADTSANTSDNSNQKKLKRRLRNLRKARTTYSFRIFAETDFDVVCQKPVAITNRDQDAFPIYGIMAPEILRSFRFCSPGEKPHTALKWSTGSFRQEDRPRAVPIASSRAASSSDRAPPIQQPAGLQPKSCIPCPPQAFRQAAAPPGQTFPWKAPPGEAPVPYLGWYKSPPPKGV